MKEIIAKWWESLEFAQKEIITDGYPKQFTVKYVRGHPLGECSIFMTFKVKAKGRSSDLIIGCSQTDC